MAADAFYERCLITNQALRGAPDSGTPLCAVLGWPLWCQRRRRDRPSSVEWERRSALRSFHAARWQGLDSAATVGVPIRRAEVRAERIFDRGLELGGVQLPVAQLRRADREVGLVEHPTPGPLCALQSADLHKVAELPLGLAEVARCFSDCHLYGSSGSNCHDPIRQIGVTMTR
jgi:hypothetical protein